MRLRHQHSALLLLLLLQPAACRSAAPQASGTRSAPAEAAPGAITAADPVVEATRQMEEELESPAVPASDGSVAAVRARSARVPGTLEVAFRAGSDELAAPELEALAALAASLRTAAVAYPIELVAADAGSGGERELRLARRRLEQVRSQLQKAGVEAGQIVLIDPPAAVSGAAGTAAAPRSCVFVVVREP